MMGLAKEFEDLRVWQDARLQANNIYDAFQRCVDHSFKDQIQRAAVSVMNNIAEGFERDTRPEFRRFLAIAKGSCGEVRSMSHLAHDRGYIDSTTGETFRNFSKQLSRGIKALSKSLN